MNSRPPPHPDPAHLHAVCLDFDGTVMVYDDPCPCFHPEVIDVLNALGIRGVPWCSNSGRTLLDQQAILEACFARGLDHPPAALMCVENFLFPRENGEYVSHDPWNRHVCSLLPRLHLDVQRVVAGSLEDWKQRYQPKSVDIHLIGTAFFIDGDDRRPAVFRQELAACLDGIPDAVVTRNGGWVFVAHARLGKGRVLQACAERFGWSPDQVLAVGDNYNDLDMLDGSVTTRVGCPADAVSEVRAAVVAAGGWVAAQPGPVGTAQIIRTQLALSPPL